MGSLPKCNASNCCAAVGAMALLLVFALVKLSGDFGREHGGSFAQKTTTRPWSVVTRYPNDGSTRAEYGVPVVFIELRERCPARTMVEHASLLNRHVIVLTGSNACVYRPLHTHSRISVVSAPRLINNINARQTYTRLAKPRKRADVHDSPAALRRFHVLAELMSHLPTATPAVMLVDPSDVLFADVTRLYKTLTPAAADVPSRFAANLPSRTAFISASVNSLTSFWTRESIDDFVRYINAKDWSQASEHGADFEAERDDDGTLAYHALRLYERLSRVTPGRSGHEYRPRALIRSLPVDTSSAADDTPVFDSHTSVVGAEVVLSHSRADGGYEPMKRVFFCNGEPFVYERQAGRLRALATLRLSEQVQNAKVNNFFVVHVAHSSSCACTTAVCETCQPLPDYIRRAEVSLSLRRELNRVCPAFAV